MKNKVFYKLLVILMLASMVLSACGGAATQAPIVTEAPAITEAPAATSAPATEVPATEAPVAEKPSGKLVIWAQQANQDVWEKTVLPGFKAEYPDIEIEFVNNTPVEVANQVGLAIQGGTGVPDLAVTEYRSLTALAELNATMLGYCTKEGKIYCVPWDIGPVVTFYRRDIFEAAGLASDPDSVSDMVATYEDYLATCITIKEKTGLNCFALNKANNIGTMLENMLWQQGLGFYDAEGNVTIDAP